MFLSGGISPIGLDIGPRAIGAVQGQRTRGGWRITAAAVVHRPDEAEGVPSGEELSRLADILYRQGFRGRDVVLCVPDRQVMSGTMELPPAHSGAPVEQLAKGELARMHRKDLQQLETAAWRIPAPARSGNFSYLMAVGAQRSEIERLVEALEDSGGSGRESAGVLSVAAMEIRACAMARACGPVLEGTHNISAILDLGEADAVLSVVHGGAGRTGGAGVVYERVMGGSSGGAGIGLLRAKLRQDLGLAPDVADHLLEAVGISGAEGREGGDAAGGPGLDAGMRAKAAELIRDYFTGSGGSGMIQELRTALAYAVHRYPESSAAGGGDAPGRNGSVAAGGGVDRVLAVGIGAAVPGLVQWMSEELGLEIGIVTPAGIAACPEWLAAQCEDPSLTTAMGLAQHGGCGGGTGNGAEINLVPALRVLARRRAARMRRWVSVVPALATILMGSYAWLRTAWHSDPSRLTAAIESLATTSASLEEGIIRDRGQIEQQRLRLLASRAVGEQPDWGVLLFILASHLGTGPEEVVLSTCQLDPVLPAGGAAAAAGGVRPEQFRLTLTGLGRDQSAVSAFVLALDGMAEPQIFERVRLVESRRVPLAGKDAVQFRIECALRDEVGGVRPAASKESKSSTGDSARRGER